MFTDKKFSISGDFLKQQLGNKFRLYPPDEVYVGTRGDTNYSSVADLSREVCYYTLIKDCSPFVTDGLREIIEKNNLLAFVYACNNLGVNDCVSVVITAGKEVWLQWNHDLWPWITIEDVDPKREHVYLIRFDSRGSYRIASIGEKVFIVDEHEYFRSSEFNLEKLSSIRIYDRRAFDALEKELRCYVEPD